MTTVIAVFLVALMITAVSIPWVRRLAIAIGFVDDPAGRKLHAEPMPLMGGVAIVGGAVVAFVVALLFALVCAGMVRVLYRREFRSNTLRALDDGAAQS